MIKNLEKGRKKERLVSVLKFKLFDMKINFFDRVMEY